MQSSFNVPSIGLGPAAEGRRAALRSFNRHFNDLDGNMLTDLTRVQNGTGPQEYKDAFVQTLHGLAAAIDPHRS